MEKASLIGIGIGCIALLLSIIGLAIPYWYSYDSSLFGIAYSVHSGLWQLCTEVRGFTTCRYYKESSLSDAFRAVRALEILGMLFMIGALICAILKQFVMKTQKSLAKVAGGVAILAGVLMIAGIIVYATLVNVERLHAGFGLCIVAGVFAIAAGAVMLAAGNKE